VTDYSIYKEYATTETQQKYLDAVIEHGTRMAAAKALGVHHSTLNDSIQRIINNASRRGVSPDHDFTHAVPEGYIVKGTSTLYRDDEVKLQWVKTSIDAEKQYALMKAASDAFASEIPREEPVTHLTVKSRSDLLNLYVLTDYHLGMYSWHEESGEDWDIDIAEQLLYKWIDAAVNLSPDTDSCVFAQLGDMLHWDGLDAVTPTNRHILDADTRFQKVVRVAIRVVRRIIGRLLQKHKKVHVIMADANHDPAGSVWLREWLAAFYEDEPRLIVDQSADTYYAHEFGKTSLFFHHGHKKQVSNVSDVFAAKFRDTFGRTKYSYAHLGHRHHIEVKENNLMIVEQHRTLAAKDAYASRGGWLSGRDAKVITYSSEYGEVSRVTVTPEMLN
jgi:hypothetical protein